MPAVEWPSLLEDMTSALRSAALSAGIPAGSADSFALDACRAVIASCFAGGTVQVYIPSEKTVERRQRNIEIRIKSKRMNIKQLCEEYPELSEPRIRHILSPPPKRKRKGKHRKISRKADYKAVFMKNQMDMF